MAHASLKNIHVIEDPAQAAALMDAIRLRILAELQEADSAAGVARRVGLPRQKVNYHLRELEQAGLVRLVREQRKGNCNERIVQAVARGFVLSPTVLGDVGVRADATERGTSEHLLATAVRVLGDSAKVHGAPSGFPVSTGEFEIAFANDADRRAFAEDVLGEITRLAAEYHDPSAGAKHRLVVMGYPSVPPL